MFNQIDNNMVQSAVVVYPYNRIDIGGKENEHDILVKKWTNKQKLHCDYLLLYVVNVYLVLLIKYRINRWNWC